MSATALFKHFTTSADLLGRYQPTREGNTGGVLNSMYATWINRLTHSMAGGYTIHTINITTYHFLCSVKHSYVILTDRRNVYFGGRLKSSYVRQQRVSHAILRANLRVVF